MLPLRRAEKYVLRSERGTAQLHKIKKKERENRPNHFIPKITVSQISSGVARHGQNEELQRTTGVTEAPEQQQREKMTAQELEQAEPGP